MKKKIVFLMPVHPDVGKGGAEYQAGLLLDRIKKNINYKVIFMARRVPENRPVDHEIIKIGDEKGIGKIGTFMDTLKVYRYLKKISPDVIYQNIGCAYTGVAAFYKKKYKSNLVWHVASDSDVWPQKIKFGKMILLQITERFMLDYGIRNADQIVAQTEIQNEYLKKRYNRKCDEIIPVCHPYPKILKEKKKKIQVLWIANIKALKQPEIFIELAKRLEKEIKAEFIMIGDKKISDRKFIDLTEKMKQTKNLKYLGRMAQDEVNSMIEESHILVNTSLYEGFSNTFVQAWMRKVPVVSLNADPDNYISKEKIGYLSGNIDNLIKDVEKLIKDDCLRIRMGEKARIFSKENFTLEKMLNKFEYIFDKI